MYIWNQRVPIAPERRTIDEVQDEDNAGKGGEGTASSPARPSEVGPLTVGHEYVNPLE